MRLVTKQGVVRSFHQWRAELQWGNKKRHLGFFERCKSRRNNETLSHDSGGLHLSEHELMACFKLHVFLIATIGPSSSGITPPHYMCHRSLNAWGWLYLLPRFVAVSARHALLCAVLYAGTYRASPPIACAATAAAEALLLSRALVLFSSGTRVAGVQHRRSLHERAGHRSQPRQGGVRAPPAHRRPRKGPQEQAIRAAAPPTAHRALAGTAPGT